MTNPMILCLGCGYTARAFAANRQRAGWRVAGTTRSAERAEALRAAGIAPVIWDGALPEDAVHGASAILVSTPPDEDGCPALAALGRAPREALAGVRWIGYLSTNGVYGDHGGAWVDETSALNATSARGRRRIEAEKGWAAFRDGVDAQIVIFRLPGIYGPGRSAFDAIRAGTAKRIYKEGQVFSRAHVDDIAAALAASLDNPSAGDLFNIADDAPAPPQDVTAYACEILGAPIPPLTPLEDADLSEMGRSFYADNKRVSNARMKARLGVKLQYPTYREGLRAILAAETKSRPAPRGGARLAPNSEK